MDRSDIAPLIRALRSLLGTENVLSARSDLVVYECDGFTIEKNQPEVVVFPRSTRQVAEVVKLANEHRVPVVPRGAGTSLAGGRKTGWRHRADRSGDLHHRRPTALDAAGRPLARDRDHP